MTDRFFKYVYTFSYAEFNYILVMFDDYLMKPKEKLGKKILGS